MLIIRKYAVLMVIILLVGCKKDDVPKPLDLSLKSAELIQSDNEFGLKLFRDVLETAEKDENVMISPLSISLALTMAYNGAEGETRVAMEQAMEMSGLSRADINDLNKQLVDALLAHDPSVTLEIANSVWYRDDFVINPDFIDINTRYYNAEVRGLDFGNPNTKKTINNWVADKTHNRIDQIVDQISAESFMFLINAIYFKGTWRYEFDKKDTFDGEFFITEDASVTVPMMKQEMDLNMYRNELFSAVELPYGKGNWSMFLFLPEDENGIEDIVAALDSQTWSAWMDSFIPAKEVNVMVPRFSFEFETSLADVLKAMGMEVAFSDAADFSGILDGGGIMISDVRHKTFVEVNEEGTEAAAVTSVEMELTSIGNFFSANRPFLFVIAEKSSKTILFAGKLVHPAG